MWNLFIDDQINDFSLGNEQAVRDPLVIDPKRKYLKAESYEKALELIEEQGCCPHFISFDHDLGENQPTGYDLAKFLVEKDLDEPGWIPSNFQFQVHSANPIGKQNIEGLLNNYLKRR